MFHPILITGLQDLIEGYKLQKLGPHNYGVLGEVWLVF